jgi:hypothetical protein
VKDTRTAKMDLISNVDVMNYQMSKGLDVIQQIDKDEEDQESEIQLEQDSEQQLEQDSEQQIEQEQEDNMQ